MATNFIDVESRSLRQHYVYYDRLKEGTDSQKKLHESILGRVLGSIDAANRPKTLTTRLRSQAQRERDKECALLREVFGVELSLEYTNPKGASDFIDVFNDYLNLRDIYERNKQIIVNSQDKKGVFSYFPTYFKKVLDATWQDTVGKLNISTEETIHRGITEWLENSVPLAIKEMFLAKPELKDMSPELEGAYKELLGVIGQVNTSGSFANQIASIYKINELANEIQEALNLSKDQISDVIKKRCKVSAQKGGLSLEALNDLIAATIQQSQKKSGGHATVGGKNMRVDNVSTYNIDIGPILEQLENAKVNESRENAVDLFNQINQKMGEQGRGFIVYTSAKNYTLDAGFKERGGFQAGANVSARQLDTLIEKAGYNSKEFVGAVLQFAEGAIGGDYSTQMLEDALAQMIAYFLFDDYDALKTGLTNGTNTLHIMNLNGILLPISSVLFALADAIDRTVDMSPRSLVEIRFNIPPILFKTEKEQRQWEQDNTATPREAWDYQRNLALDETKVSIHFLANLREMLQGMHFR